MVRPPGPRARARIELYGGDWTVDVDADGWWLLVADAPGGAAEAEAAETEGVGSLRDTMTGIVRDASGNAPLQVVHETVDPSRFPALSHSDLRVTID